MIIHFFTKTVCHGELEKWSYLREKRNMKNIYQANVFQLWILMLSFFWIVISWISVLEITWDNCSLLMQNHINRKRELWLRHLLEWNFKSRWSESLRSEYHSSYSNFEYNSTFEHIFLNLSTTQKVEKSLSTDSNKKLL